MTDIEIRERILALRGVEDPCSACGGLGCRAYSSTATWVGGIGGQMITNNVCDKCWGTGDKNHTGVDLRKLKGEMKARRIEIRRLKDLLKEWRDWQRWVDDFGKRVDEELV